MTGEFNRLTGDGISSAPRFAIHDFEGAKTDYVNPLAFLELALDDLNQQIDQTQRIAIRQAAVTLVNNPCEIGLGHDSASCSNCARGHRPPDRVLAARIMAAESVQAY